MVALFANLMNGIITFSNQNTQMEISLEAMIAWFERNGYEVKLKSTKKVPEFKADCDRECGATVYKAGYANSVQHSPFCKHHKGT